MKRLILFSMMVVLLCANGQTFAQFGNRTVGFGFGVSKAIAVSGSDFLSLVPMGVGIQTRVSSSIILKVSGGYTLSLTDKLEERTRTRSGLNSLTNKKHDGYFGFLAGLMFTAGSGANADPDKDGLTTKVEKEPVASNDTEAGRAENRRIEFYV